MGVITDLIGNYQKTKLAEQQQKMQQIGREVQVNRAVLSTPDVSQDDPGFAQQRQDKQAAAANLDRLLDQYGGPQAKTHRPVISTVLHGLASGVLGGLGVQRQQQTPQTPKRTGPPPAFDPQALVPGATGVRFGQLQPPGQLATLAGPRPGGAQQPLQGISPDALREARLSVLAGGKAEQEFDEQRAVLQQALQRGDITKDQYQDGIREALKIKPDPVAQAKAIEQAKLDIDQAAAEGQTKKALQRLEGIKNLLSPDEYQRIRAELETGIKLPAAKSSELVGEARDLQWAKGVQAHPENFSESDQQVAKDIIKKWEQGEESRAGLIAQRNQQAEKLPTETAEFWAGVFLKTGSMPPGAARYLGRTGMQQIMATIPEIAKAQNLTTGQMIAQQADVVALRRSLGTMETQYAQVSSFEKTAQQNLARAIEAASKIGDSGSPIFNRPYRQVQKDLEGKPELAAYEAARQTAVSEVGKVLSGSMGNGAVSDSARDEASSLLNGNYTLAQLQAAADMLQRDMESRTSNMKETIDGIKEQIAGPPTGGGAPAGRGGAVDSGGAAAPKLNDVRTYNGDTYRFDGTKWVKQKPGQ